jgi:hypothetical protein
MMRHMGRMSARVQAGAAFGALPPCRIGLTRPLHDANALLPFYRGA